MTDFYQPFGQPLGQPVAPPPSDRTPGAGGRPVVNLYQPKQPQPAYDTPEGLAALGLSPTPTEGKGSKTPPPPSVSPSHPGLYSPPSAWLSGPFRGQLITLGK